MLLGDIFYLFLSPRKHTNFNNNGNSGASSDNKPSKLAEPKPSGDNNSSTEQPHVHSYDSGVVTKEPNCTHIGTKVYTYVNGDLLIVFS